MQHTSHRPSSIPERKARMPITATPKVWMNGTLVDWADAKVHVLTHTLHYGTGVFEGMRAYPTSFICFNRENLFTKFMRKFAERD